MIQSGIINLLKPAGMTSHDAVSALRRLTGVKRIGHTGTLDPMAAGVLPLCIGSAARINEYLELDYKSYRCEMQLGIETDTHDIWGNVTQDLREHGFLQELREERESREHGFPQELREERESPGERDSGVIGRIEAALKSQEGFISQYPPSYWAIQVNGRRLYDYARHGEAVDVPPRKVHVKSISLIRIDFESARVTFDAVCSKGTYIRAICRDAGRILGCGATMSFLARTSSGAFTLENTVTFEELAENGLAPYLLMPDFPLVHFGKGVVSADRGKWFANGGQLSCSDVRVVKAPEFGRSGTLPQAGSGADSGSGSSDSEDSPLKIREEYRRAYNIYTDSGKFLGVAFFDSKTRSFKADKIFLTDLL